jgi:glycosyltransferase involved in cell wall biosynthesis
MLVSCICPTANRRALLPVALACYLAQDWPWRELIVVDDGAEPIADLLEGVPDAIYVRTAPGRTVSEKVNLCCEMAHGEIISTWDDDDWSASNRLGDQVTRLLESGKFLTGYSNMLFFDGMQASLYKGSPDYAVGTSQVYRKAFWAQHRLRPKQLAYDNDLWLAAHKEQQVICVEGNGMMVARIHGQNVTGQRTAIGGEYWPIVPVSDLPAAFLEAIQ